VIVLAGIGAFFSPDVIALVLILLVYLGGQRSIGLKECGVFDYVDG